MQQRITTIIDTVRYFQILYRNQIQKHQQLLKKKMKIERNDFFV